MPDIIDKVSLQDQIAEVRREIEMRKQVYPRLIDSNKMSRGAAEHRTLCMQAVLRTLENLRS